MLIYMEDKENVRILESLIVSLKIYLFRNKNRSFFYFSVIELKLRRQTW